MRRHSDISPKENRPCNGSPDATASRGTPGVAAPGSRPSDTKLPAWLTRQERYDPPHDADGFIARSVLSLAGVLARLRMDDGKSGPLSPSPAAKLAIGFACILLTSLSSNFLFVLVMLALVLVRAIFLPASALRRLAGVTATSAALSLLVMLPAILLNQAHAPLLVGTKVLVTTAIALEVALTTPAHELMGALGFYRVPDVVILTLGLTLKNIVVLGTVALEMLEALRLRSVGKNSDKRSSIGGIGGMLFLKSRSAAETTAQAMQCRGFEGDYHTQARHALHQIDALWASGLVLLVLLFVYLQSLV